MALRCRTRFSRRAFSVMKSRTTATVSERELMAALRQEGVAVSLAELGDWRKEGLMPPLSSRGRGAGGGRVYYWSEANILDQARCVHDLLARHGRHSTAMLVLWLCGYPVSMAKARRAWLQRARRPRNWQIRNAALADGAAAGGETVLLQAILKLCSSFADSQRSEMLEMQDALLRAGAALGFPEMMGNELRHRVFTALGLVLAAIESSSLLAAAGDSDLEAARALTETCARLVRRLDAPQDIADPIALAHRMEALGKPLFLCALLLQRTGYRSHLAQSHAAMRLLLTRLGKDAAERSRLLAAFRAEIAQIWAAGPEAARRTNTGLGAQKTARALSVGLVIYLGFRAQMLLGDIPDILLAG